MPPWHSTSVHWVADLESRVQKSCIVSADGGRFLVLQGKTLVADCPQCGIWSTEELRGDLSSFLRAFLIKAGMSRKSRATTFSFSMYHSLFIPRLWKWQCRISRARSVIPSRIGEGAVWGVERAQSKTVWKTSDFLFFLRSWIQIALCGYFCGVFLLVLTIPVNLAPLKKFHQVYRNMFFSYRIL